MLLEQQGGTVWVSAASNRIKKDMMKVTGLQI